MPTGLKITIVFNLVAVAILCSVASMAEPSKTPSQDNDEISISKALPMSVSATTNPVEVTVISNNVSTDINQNMEQNREATPAPWVIRADGSVQWLDAQ